MINELEVNIRMSEIVPSIAIIMRKRFTEIENYWKKCSLAFKSR